jgi:hypothetical protein
MWDVNLLVSDVCGELQGEMERHSVTCSVEPAPGLPMAYIDYKQIAFCIRSILGNSVETLAMGGAIQIITKQEEGEVVVDITDNAKDIPFEAMDPMTTPFSATQELGSGSALSLCKAIFDKHGLPFDMVSTAGGGRRFILRLPGKKEES